MRECVAPKWLASAIILLAGFASGAKTEKAAPAPVAPKAGIKTPGIQIPIQALKPEAEVAVETPAWIATADSAFFPNRSKDSILRVEPKTGKALDPISGLNKPCSGLVSAFGSLWIPNCGSQALVRYDAKANKVTATIESGVADALIGIAADADSIWMLTDAKSTLSRIDPVENKVVGELRLPGNCTSVAFGEMSLWVACPSETRLLRINPQTNLVEKRIEVSAGARSITFGDGSVWVLCDKDGKIDRIDPKTNKVIKTIDLATPNAGGNIAYGEGWLWVSQTGFPLTRIDTKTEKEGVVQQFWGDGGGLVAVSPGAIWLSNVSKGGIWKVDPKRVIATLAE